MNTIRTLAERFCTAQLPDSVCADFCATVQGPNRTGTNLLTVQEAEVVLGYTLGALPAAARDVLVERQRQVDAEGWTPAHDDQHTCGELAVLAAIYAVMHADAVVVSDPHLDSWIKPQGTRRNLVRAGALILAEIERLDREALEVRP